MWIQQSKEHACIWKAGEQSYWAFKREDYYHNPRILWWTGTEADHFPPHGHRYIVYKSLIKTGWITGTPEDVERTWNYAMEHPDTFITLRALDNG